jgi:hypothetical protein
MVLAMTVIVPALLVMPSAKQEGQSLEFFATVLSMTVMVPKLTMPPRFPDAVLSVSVRVPLLEMPPLSPFSSIRSSCAAARPGKSLHVHRDPPGCE